MKTEEPIRADFQTPRTFGMLNVAYAAALMACGMCQNLMFSVPALISASNVRVNSRSVTVSTSPKPADPADPTANAPEVPALAVRLEKLEAETTDPRARDLLASLRRHEAKERARTTNPAPGLDRMGDPRIVGHLVLDLSTGLVLNLLMLISGAGLLLTKGWGRALAVGVAWLKIVRLLVLALSMTIFAAPAAVAIATGLAEGPEAASMARSFSSLLLLFSWGLVVLGSVYPALTLYFLRLPSVRAAFRPVMK